MRRGAASLPVIARSTKRDEAIPIRMHLPIEIASAAIGRLAMTMFLNT